LIFTHKALQSWCLVVLQALDDAFLRLCLYANGAALFAAAPVGDSEDGGGGVGGGGSGKAAGKSKSSGATVAAAAKGGAAAGTAETEAGPETTASILERHNVKTTGKACISIGCCRVVVVSMSDHILDLLGAVVA
jgi:hypothetical protein